MTIKENLTHYINDAHGEGYDTVEIPIEMAREILSRLEIAEKALQKVFDDQGFMYLHDALKQIRE
jgi:hypothetical protein